MSDDSKREPAAETTSPPARKSAKQAVSKAAKKTAAKKTAKKAAKKASRKTTKKVPAGNSAAGAKKPTTRPRVEAPQGELDFSGGSDARPAPAEAVPRQPVPAEVPRIALKPDEPSPRGEPGEAEGAGEEPRFGRVPGGGPVKRRERRGADAGNRETSEPASPPASDDRDRDPSAEGRPAAAAGSPQDFHSPQDSPSRQRRDRHGHEEGQDSRKNRRRRRRRRNRNAGDGESGEGERPAEQESRSTVPEGPKVEVDGLLELAPKGFGFLRLLSKKFEQARDDVFVSPDFVRRYGLRVGVWIKGYSQQGSRGPQLVEITSVNDLPPEEARKLPAFEELKAINPNKRITFETVADRYTTRVIDLVSPVGRGQRGLIVSPPRSGKTTLLLHIAEAVRERHDETMHLMVLLVDERPEEVTEFRRALPGAEIYASSNDEHPRNHTRIAEIAIERAKRLVEGGRHVFLLMDSITRLARAYNNAAGGGKHSRGRGIGSGGIMVGALETPRRLFAAARNTREAGSLTIVATALVQTNSRADDAIFQEFKGTGNMELVLDRKIAENYIYPAVDIFKSGTRREELLLPDHTLHKIHMIRRGLSGHRPVEAMERLLFFLKKFPNNPQMLMEIKG